MKQEPNPKITITVVTKEAAYECHAPNIDRGEDPVMQTLSEEEALAVGLVENYLKKPTPLVLSLRSGGVICFGPLSLANSQIIIEPVRSGPVSMPEPPDDPARN